MKPNKCPYALIFNGIKICNMKVLPCKRVTEKDCCVSDKHKNPIEELYMELAKEWKIGEKKNEHS